MASGHTVPVAGMIELLGLHCFCVADIATNPILGADFIVGHGLDIAVRARQLQLPFGAKWPLLTPAPSPPTPPSATSPSSATQPVYSIVLFESVVFAADQREMIVAGLVIDALTKDPCRSSSGPLLSGEFGQQIGSPSSSVACDQRYRHNPGTTLQHGRKTQTFSKANVLERLM